VSTVRARESKRVDTRVVDKPAEVKSEKAKDAWAIDISFLEVAHRSKMQRSWGCSSVNLVNLQTPDDFRLGRFPSGDLQPSTALHAVAPPPSSRPVRDHRHRPHSMT
jgi:hypothetical protein